MRLEFFLNLCLFIEASIVSLFLKCPLKSSYRTLKIVVCNLDPIRLVSYWVCCIRKTHLTQFFCGFSWPSYCVLNSWHDLQYASCPDSLRWCNHLRPILWLVLQDREMARRPYWGHCVLYSVKNLFFSNNSASCAALIAVGSFRRVCDRVVGAIIDDDGRTRDSGWNDIVILGGALFTAPTGGIQMWQLLIYNVRKCVFLTIFIHRTVNKHRETTLSMLSKL